jgi:predicted nuclease of predicted toxin-antitoxin system
MHWLADENLARAIVQWLRSHGDDVVYAAEGLSAREDIELLATAERDHRFIITDDKDFGELVFRRRFNTHGILLVRIRAGAITSRLGRLAAVWKQVEENIAGNLVVVTESKLRVREIPRPA